MKSLRAFLEIWFGALVVCAATAALAFARLDVPLAEHFWRTGHFLHPLSNALGASIILTVEAAVALGLILARVIRGHISRVGEASAIACLASISTYGMNSEVLKPFFGVPTPRDVIDGARHSFYFFMGSGNSSFPSGHMMLAGAFAGAFVMFYRVSLWPLCALLALAAALLVVGGWHFVSDVIAGTFVGVSAGILAGEAWIVHSKLLR
ncbi:MAG: phosphatase PAP2 family protein [Steroidobacteraceae bacterium]